MGLNKKDIVYLSVVFLMIVVVVFISQTSSSFTVDESKVKDYILEIYNRRYIITAVGVMNGLIDSNGIHHFKGHFEDEPDIEVQFDMIENQLSKYYWSEKNTDWYNGEYFNNYVNMYYEVNSAHFKVKKGNDYQHFEPSMDFDDIIEYLEKNHFYYYIIGEFQIDCANMSKKEIESLAEILYNDFKDLGYFFDFTFIGNITDNQTVKIKMSHQKWLPEKDERVQFEYYGIQEGVS